LFWFDITRTDLFNVPDDMDEPNLTILVAGKEQFPHSVTQETWFSTHFAGVAQLVLYVKNKIENL
jgi:hypothetical protein